MAILRIQPTSMTKQMFARRHGDERAFLLLGLAHCLHTSWAAKELFVKLCRQDDYWNVSRVVLLFLAITAAPLARAEQAAE